MTPITLLLVVVVVFGEVTPPINCAFRSGRMHDSFFCQTLHINCTKRGLAMHQQGFHEFASLNSTRCPATYRCR
jgi:hypothetical protein